MKIIIILFILSVIIFIILSSIMILKNIMKPVYIGLEEVYSDPILREDYGIFDKKTPQDYGFDYKEVVFCSHKKRLKGWYIPSQEKRSDKVIIFLHGRTSNRLVVLEYLDIIREKGLNKEYAIFMPDLRGSGDSDKGLTALGYYYKEDIFAAINYMKNGFNKTKVVLYGFSMGALGSAYAIEKYYNILKQKDIEIKALILDSPLSNSKERIIDRVKKLPLSNFYIKYAPFLFNIVIGNNLKKLYLGYLLNKIEVPILILQSLEDKTTKYSILKEELKKLKKKNNIYLQIFQKGEHVKIYRINKENYSLVIERFFQM
ncbi:hypothetical protein EV215_1738 [Hypnocyclicus thermotrophus]|uniref:AB hydrolase-1 domain-containing protein n=1 Tax=Hypnocyclicus thermotrophus TaxID=1627895 RepID=A0AA46DXD6_9FUSO|nr:alpha/beta fold hydrolase [Hypnocyclicus thermotrophus]TDT68018.1 hypothetical protein EV215_1738 [Hypnocyclicus thermotrophus]